MTDCSNPKHIAIIMDGNNRWAKQKGLEKGQGHVAGEEALRKTLLHAANIGIPFITVFAFSSENWQRPKEEVDFLMELFTDALENKVSNFSDKNIAVKFIGDRSVFSEKIQQHMQSIESRQLAQPDTIVNVALNYGGRWDIVDTAKRLAQAVQSEAIQINDITEKSFAQAMSLGEAPDIDLCIRTASEYRVSNFLLWHLAYAELYFTDIYWPDFDEQALEVAIAFYTNRERRFGKTSEQILNQRSVN